MPTCEIGNVDDHVGGDQNNFTGLEVEQTSAELALEEAEVKLDDVSSSSNDTMAGDCREKGV